MAQAHTDWFHNTSSDNTLRQVLSDYSKDLLGSRKYVLGGRCTLANELEKLDAIARRMGKAKLQELGWM